MTIHLSTSEGVYFIGFCLVLCISWAAFSVDIPDRATKCAECDAERRQSVFMRDAVRAQGPQMVVMMILLNSVMWPMAVMGALSGIGAHRRHAGRIGQ